MESDDTQSFRMSLDSSKKTVTTMHSRLLQLRQQQLCRQQVQQGLMRDFQSCLARPTLFRETQMGLHSLPASEDKYCTSRALASSVCTTCTSARGKRRPVRHKRQHGTLPHSIFKLHVPRRHCPRCPQPGGQSVCGPHGPKVSPEKDFLSGPFCGMYYSILGVKPDASSQEIRKVSTVPASIRCTIFCPSLCTCQVSTVPASIRCTKVQPTRRALLCSSGFTKPTHLLVYLCTQRPESRKAYDIQIACRALVPLLATEEASERAGTRGDESKLVRNTSHPPYKINFSAVSTRRAHSPSLFSCGWIGTEDDSRRCSDASYSKSSLYSAADIVKWENERPNKDLCHGQLGSDKVSKIGCVELSCLRVAGAELHRPVSPFSLRVTSSDESSTLAWGRLYSDSINKLPTSPKTYGRQTNPTWAEFYFDILRELFFKPILPDYIAQKFPRLHCPQDLSLRLQHLLMCLPRLRYHRNFFVQPFSVGRRCATSLSDKKSAGDQLTLLKSSNPTRRTPCSPFHKKVSAESLFISSWQQLPRQIERIGVSRVLAEKGGSCVVERCLHERNNSRRRSSAAQAHVGHLEAEADHVNRKASFRTTGRSTGRRDDGEAGSTWWIAALREELSSSGNGDDYRYVQLLPPPTQDDKDSWTLHSARTISFTKQNTATSDITIERQRFLHQCSKENKFGDEQSPTNVRLTNILKKSQKQCSLEEQFLSLWGIVFLKNRQVVDDLRSAVQKILNGQRSEAPPRPEACGSESLPALKKGPIGCPAIRSSPAIGHCDGELASRSDARKAERFKTPAISIVPSANHSDQASPRNTPSATLDHHITCLLGHLALLDCLVLLMAPLEQCTVKRQQSFSCNAVCGPAASSSPEGTHAPFRARRRGSQKPCNSHIYARLGTSHASNASMHFINTFFRTMAADGPFAATVGPRLPSGRRTTSTSRALAGTREFEDSRASFGISSVDVFLPVWRVTMLDSQKRLEEEYRKQYPLVASSANMMHYMLLQPQEPTLRWLGHALVELCGYAAAEL